MRVTRKRWLPEALTVGSSHSFCDGNSGTFDCAMLVIFHDHGCVGLSDCPIACLQ